MKLYPVIMNANDREVTFLWVLANDEKTVLKGIESKFTHNSWQDNYEDYSYEGYDSYLDYMLDIRGEINSQDVMGNALENSVQYGWDEGKDIDEASAQIMLNYGVAKDWRNIA
jgi:CRISPR/Cas system-associated exonuclease Cas4 (RecB family)